MEATGNLDSLVAYSIDLAKEKGAQCGLITLPLNTYNFDLSKTEFPEMELNFDINVKQVNSLESEHA